MIGDGEREYVNKTWEAAKAAHRMTVSSDEGVIVIDCEICHEVHRFTEDPDPFFLFDAAFHHVGRALDGRILFGREVTEKVLEAPKGHMPWSKEDHR